MHRITTFRNRLWRNHSFTLGKSSRELPPLAAATAAASLMTASILFLSPKLTLSLEPFFDYDIESYDQGHSEPARFQQALKFHRSLLPEYRWKWAYGSAANSRVPRSTGWPKPPPTEEEITRLELDLNYCLRSGDGSKENDYYCENLQFRVAQYYLSCDGANLQQKGYRFLKDLAGRNHPDAMCLYGIVLNEGRVRGIEADPRQATIWWRRAVDSHRHLQSAYELAVALFTGEGVAEDEEMAVKFFKKAANMGHAGAAYMLGDCLLDGIGIKRDRAEALEWLVTAGELGHRGARSRVMAVLEKEEGADYGEFTDASRQTFKKSQVAEAKKNQQEEEQKWSEADARRIVSIERRYTIGGGSRNPVVLARRKTVVEESRTDG